MATALSTVYWYTLKDNESGKWITSGINGLIIDDSAPPWQKFSFIYASYDSHGRNYYIYSHGSDRFLAAAGPNSPITFVEAGDPNISTFYLVDWSPGVWVALGQDSNSTIGWDVSNGAIIVSDSGDPMIVDFGASDWGTA